jgi:DNA-binding LacI/PurR family transcriptional regulator
LEEHPEVTAIFAANDVMAFGAVRAILERGLRIPEDQSLIGLAIWSSPASFIRL